MIRPLTRSTRSKYRSWLVYCSLIISISLPFIRIQAFPDPLLYAGKDANTDASIVSPVQENRETQQLELSKPIERESAGGQSHSYEMTLAAGQYAKLVVEQRGIDVVVKLFGPDRKQVLEFNSESRSQERETVEWVAEATGNYRVDVLAKQKNAAAGQYEIQVTELRVATEDDRALNEARRLNTAFLRLYRAGRYDEALPLGERALDIRKRVLGPENPDVASSLNNLANLYRRRGDYTKAEPLYRHALTIREKLFGPDHPDVATVLNALAILHISKGDYEKAERLLQRALIISEKSFGPDHPDVGIPLNNLAILYKERGDYTKAEPLYQRSLNLKEKALGPEHPDLATTLNNLANLYLTKREYTKAEPIYQRSLSITEKALGREHPYVARALNNLANLYKNRGDYAKAEQLYQRSLNIKEKALGLEHHDLATTFYNLANLYKQRGDYAKAEPLYQRSLSITEKALGPEHPAVALCLKRLAMLYATNGDIARANAFQSRATAIEERNFARTLAIGSERQKLAYLDIFSKWTDFTLWLHSQAAPNDPQALNLAFTTLLRRKGRGLDAMTDTIATLRRHAKPEDLVLFDRLTDARSQLAELILKEPDAAEPDTYRTLVKPLEDEVDSLEAELSSRSAKFREQTQPVTLATIQAALPSGSALVEFAVHSPLDPQTEKSKPPRYLAYLLAPQGQPKWVDLGEADPIDRAVNAWRKALRNPNRIDIKRLARVVDEKVMRPVRSLLSQLPGDTRLLIAPDGSLNLIPFAALVDERNSYLVERYSISYLTSGRDLLRFQTSNPSKSAPLVLADPRFGTGEIIAGTPPDQNPANSPAGDLPSNEAPARNYLREIFFQPLPGTRREALAIKAVLPEASLLLREDATEAALKQARAPRILHIATHGFFLEDQEALPPETRSLSIDNPLRISDPRVMKWAAKIENPLLRSGLALAGVNQHQGGDDGLLTALETASLDLWGTKLVVLSACDTGVGKVENGEGVYGLRRALVLAGSESQVISLWPVSDRDTRGLMAGYYKRLMKGEGRGEALRQIQLEMLKNAKLRHPYYWASFIQAGEWANLDGKR
jgi:CHAT domain-containing protein/tetratricopeptide (TPR) repeat protein